MIRTENEYQEAVKQLREQEARPRGEEQKLRELRAYPRTVGDCPDFAESSGFGEFGSTELAELSRAEQNETVPFSETVLGSALKRERP